MENHNYQNEKTLYEPSFEHDACGIGAIVNIDGTKSYTVVDNALSIVEKLEHRAGKDASGETGDGVGILLQIPHEFFSEAAVNGEIVGSDGTSCTCLGDERDYGVGMFFLSSDSFMRNKTMKLFENLCQKEDLKFLGWRTVPIAEDVLGEKAHNCMPVIMQCFVARPENCAKGIDFDRKLYILRRHFEKSCS